MMDVNSLSRELEAMHVDDAATDIMAESWDPELEGLGNTALPVHVPDAGTEATFTPTDSVKPDVVRGLLAVIRRLHGLVEEETVALDAAHAEIVGLGVREVEARHRSRRGHGRGHGNCCSRIRIRCARAATASACYRHTVWPRNPDTRTGWLPQSGRTPNSACRRDRSRRSRSSAWWGSPGN